MRRIGELIEHDGKLAQWRGDRKEYDGARAWYVEQIAVSAAAMADSDGPVPLYANLIGKVVSGGDWSGYVALDWSDIYVDTSSWVWQEVRTEIVRPRDSRLYTWEWDASRREWRKIGWARRCGSCDQYHNPAIPVCETCWNCHGPKARCR